MHNDKIVVFHIIPHFDMGGSEIVAKNIALSESNDIEYHVIEVYNGHSDYTLDLISQFKNNRVIVHRSNFKNKKVAILLFWKNFLSLAKQFKPDIIHTHTEIPDLALYLSHIISPKLRHTTHWIRTVHSTVLWTGWKKIGDLVERLINSIGTNVAVSRTAQESYQAAYGTLPILIYNGVLKPKRKTFPAGTIMKNRINILFAGRFELEKGIDIIIQLVRHYAKSGKFFFHLVGAGTLSEKVESDLKGLSNYKISKPIWGLNEWLNNYDLVMMPSKFEGLGLLSIESTLSGTPVIISPDNALKETVPNDWPLIAATYNADSYIQILDNLDCYDLATLKVKAFSIASKRFDLQYMRNQYEQLYYNYSNQRK